jgi:hypothetical protein
MRFMTICNPRTLPFAIFVCLLPMGFAIAGGGGSGGRALGGGVGAPASAALQLAAERRREQ